MLVIVQARLSSKRFKNKVLSQIYGAVLIQHIINRLKKSKKIKEIVVSTSKNKTDDKLIKYLKPKRAILTNLHADIDYNYIKKYLPKNVSPGYDGMSFLI